MTTRYLRGYARLEMLDKQNIGRVPAVTPADGVSQRPRIRFFSKLSPLERFTAKWGIVFVLPLIIGLIAFVYGPVLMALALSFTDYAS